MRTPLKYHHATSELLWDSLIALSDQSSLTAPAEVPQPIPASIREWYGINDAVALLHRFGNDDGAFAPHEFDCRTDGGTTIVRFMIENQGCASWGYVANTDSDDPPVFVNQEPDWWHRPRWEFCTERFSEFVFLRVFDYQFLKRQFEDPIEQVDEFFGDSKSVPPPVLQALNTQFEKMPSSCDWPDLNVMRFQQTPDKRIVIQQHGGSAQWLLLASSRNARRELVQEIVEICDKFGFAFNPPRFS